MLNRCLPVLFLIIVASSLQAQNGLIKILGPDFLCQGQCDTLYSSIGDTINLLPPYTYTWTGSGGFTSTQRNIVVCADFFSNYTLTVTSANGYSFSSSPHAVYVIPFQQLNIISSNTAPCNADSTTAFCEKVCPNTTVTYSLQGENPGSQPLPPAWQVAGASSYQVNNPPFNNSITVTWGEAGSGSVSVFSNGQGGPVTGGCSGEDAICVTIIQAPNAQFATDPASIAGSLTVCKGQTVYLDNQSTADYSEWFFSDDLSTTFEDDPQHVFQTPGNYVVRLIARSTCLCSDTTTLNVTVLDAVSPMLDCVGTICPNETVTYTASNGCAPYAWSVTPNGTVLNGGTSTSDTITVQWTNGPSGTITLGAQACSGMVCPQPAIIHVPVISDAAEIKGKERVCGSSEEKYSIEPYSGTGFIWSLSGGGTIQYGQGTDQVYVSWTAYPDPSQTYWLSVKYDNCYLGCGGQDSIAVHILSPFIIDGPVEACAGATASFNAKLTTPAVNLIANWTLHGPDGSTVWTSATALASVNVPFATTDGIYQLLAEPADPSQTCSDQATWAINVAPLPASPTGISGPVLICPNNIYTYEALGVLPNSNLQWTVQNGLTTNTYLGNPVNISWGVAGPYALSVRQISTDGLGCLSDTIRLQVAAITLPSITGDNTVCEDATVSYTIANLEDIDIQWSTSPTGAGAIASGQGSKEVEVFWTETGNHTLSANVCGQIATFPVTVLANPQPMVQAPANVCVGQTKPVQTIGSYSNYLWRDANGAMLATTPIANLGAGSYSVQVTDGQGCVGTSEFTIAVAPNPNLNITTADFTAFCLNSNFVTISALVNADGDFQYQWFQNNMPVGGNTPTYTTNQYGLYTAIVTNQYGCTASDGPISIVNDCGSGGGVPGSGAAPFCPPGSINLAIMPTALCDSFAFQVSGAQYQPGSADWYFGESGAALLGTSNVDNPSFHFQNAGQYLVVLYAQLLNGATCRVIDSVKVVASAQFAAAPACPNSATNFQDVSTFFPGNGISSWAWDFGDPSSGANNISPVRNADHTYDASGNYPVTLTITANSGCTSAVTQAVIIPVISSPTFAPPTQNCAGNALPFNAVVGPEVTKVTWDFGQPVTGPANDATGTLVYHSFTPAGTYSVTATSTNAFGCAAIFSQNITVTPNALNGNISPANPVPICEGSTVTLTAPTGGIAWFWSDSTTTTPTFTTNKAGTYRVTIADANGCTYTPPPVTVEVKPAPDALIKALLENKLGQVIGTVYPNLITCAGEDVHLEAQGNSSNYGYVWSDGNGTDDEVFFTADRFNLLSVGTHVFTVTVTDFSSGCTAATTPFMVIVNPVPNGFQITNNGNHCAQASNIITYQGPMPGNWQFIWNNGQPGTTLPAADPGEYFIRVINEFGCEAKSNSLYFQPGPPVSAIPGGCHTRCRPDTLCLPYDLSYVSFWQWYYNGDPIPGATSQNLVAAESGTYWAVLTDSYGCVGQSDPLTLQLFDAYGNVTGQVWSDVNDNGVIDAADTLVSGIPVDLYQSGSPVAYGQSNNQGIYAFANILSANYVVQIDAASLPSNWQIVIGQKNANMSGCQTVATADLLVKFVCPTVTSQLQLHACPGGSVIYQGMSLAIGANQAFTFTSTQGCDSTVTVTVQTLPTSTSALTLFACAGSTVAYQGTQLLPGVVQDFVFQNYAGCDSTVTVTVKTAPVSASALTLTACPGSTVGYNGGQLLPGVVQDFVFQNYLGCDSTVTVTVQALPNSTSLLEVSVCPGETFEYAGASVAAGETRDFHLLTTQGCDSTVTVTVAEFPVATFALLPISSCATQPTGSLLIRQASGGLSPYQFSLNGNAAQPDSLFQTLMAGTYEVVLEDANGCIVSQNTTIEELPRLELGLSDAFLPCDSSGLEIAPVISGDTIGLHYKWWNGSTSSSAMASEAGPVWVEATNHCETVRREAMVHWMDLAADISYVYLPNIFAPDGVAQENTTFRPTFAAGLLPLHYRLEIFDRWGNLLFQSTQTEAAWEGNFHRRKMNPGVYVWQLEAEVAFCGRTIMLHKQGDVTIMR